VKAPTSHRLALSLPPRALAVRLFLAAMVCAALAGCAPGRIQPGHLRLLLMDIGEADCMLIQTHDANWLIDSGEQSSAPAIRRRLRERGVRSLDLAVLTHPHSDHMGGIREIGRSIPVRQILDSGFPLGSGVQRRLTDWIRRDGIPYRRARAGQIVRLGSEVTIEVLWPPDQYLRGTESDANNNSVVLRIKHGNARILIAGDLQSDGEARLLASGADLTAQVLKVAHQGSSDSTSGEFLQRVRPSLALIATGRRNSYGHPAPETLERLEQAGARVCRTDRDGDLTIESDGSRVSLLR